MKIVKIVKDPGRRGCSSDKTKLRTLFGPSVSWIKSEVIEINLCQAMKCLGVVAARKHGKHNMSGSKSNGKTYETNH